MFFTPFGYFAHGGGGGGMSPKGWVYNMLMRFLTLDSSKIEVFANFFSETVITENDHPSYVKHGLGRSFVVFPYFVGALLGVFSL